MTIKATFLCISAKIEPEVHVLSADQFYSLNQRLSLASKRGSDAARLKAYLDTFGRPFDYAVPAWSVEAMELVAFEYKGEHADRVKQLAACLALGETYGADERGGDDTDGGIHAHLGPVVPKTPGGDAISQMFAGVAS